MTRFVGRAVFLAIVVALASACGDDGGLLGGTSTTAADTPAVVESSTSVVTASTSPASTSPPTSVAFDPPLPQTTPNQSQPTNSLLDGTHVAFLVDVDVPGRSTDVDVVQWIAWGDFPTAISQGRLADDDPCLELDYCIVNAEDRVRTLSVMADARVSVVDWDDCCGSVRTDDLDDAFTRLREGHDLFLLTALGGEIIALDEIYIP